MKFAVSKKAILFLSPTLSREYREWISGLRLVPLVWLEPTWSQHMCQSTVAL